MGIYAAFVCFIVPSTFTSSLYAFLLTVVLLVGVFVLFFCLVPCCWFSVKHWIVTKLFTAVQVAGIVPLPNDSVPLLAAGSFCFAGVSVAWSSCFFHRTFWLMAFGLQLILSACCLMKQLYPDWIIEFAQAQTLPLVVGYISLSLLVYVSFAVIKFYAIG